jgi:hypothetical protein
MGSWVAWVCLVILLVLIACVLVLCICGFVRLFTKALSLGKLLEDIAERCAAQSTSPLQKGYVDHTGVPRGLGKWP